MTTETQVPEVKPTVGRIVHYQMKAKGQLVPRAAIVTEVSEVGVVSLCILNTNRMTFKKVKYSVEPLAGHWNWPPRS